MIPSFISWKLTTTFFFLSTYNQTTENCSCKADMLIIQTRHNLSQGTNSLESHLKANIKIESN